MLSLAERFPNPCRGGDDSRHWSLRLTDERQELEFMVKRMRLHERRERLALNIIKVFLQNIYMMYED